VDEIIFWLTGHTAESLQDAIDVKIDLETFFAEAPRFQPNASLIKGVVCGVRVEDVEDETTRKIRFLDKLSTSCQRQGMERFWPICLGRLRQFIIHCDGMGGQQVPVMRPLFSFSTEPPNQR
jgi:hypothetical protein